MENRFRMLLALFVEGRLCKQAEGSLIQAHVLHFGRRAERLPPTWFPGREKSKEAIRSLANGAYVHLAHERIRRELTAFEVAFFDYEGHELSWLYYWPRSACMQWLRQQSAQQLAPVERLRRNARNHLKKGPFEPVLSERGEPAWVPVDWPRDLRRRLPRNLERVNVDVGRMSPLKAVRAILEAVQAPLTLTQLVDVWARSLVLVPQIHGGDGLEVLGDERKSIDLDIETNELLCKVRNFWETRLTPQERALLTVRGYGAERRLRSFARVAEELGGFGPERWRQLERGLLEVAREVFEDDPSDQVAQLLAYVISESRRPVSS